ncbi:hypothetical protein [Virgibacillus doumboii]|uniref:hypothetical protein n=1 Tax=Virgibacillus doumboii TaxID=2697503 RepID=UPI0013DF73DC|nr:hypothetical protein [Virgibacillus doumboii]
MRYKFISKRKWIREGILSIFNVLLIIFSVSYSFSIIDTGYTAKAFLSILLFVFILLGTNRALYYFKLHKKDYLIIDDSSLSMYRGNILSRKLIRFNHVDRVAKINEVIVFKLDNGKEEPIYTEWLSNEDTEELKKELKCRFGSKGISLSEYSSSVEESL